MIDTGTEYRLESAASPDVEVGGEIRYGASESVPSRLDEAATGLASVVLVASADPAETRHAIEALVATAPGGTDLILVADGLPDRALEGLRGDDLVALGLPASSGRSSFGRDSSGGDSSASPSAALPIELVRTSAVLGHGAALNIGIRRSRAPIVIVLDPSVVPAADFVTSLVHALDEPTVAIAGPFGLESDDLRRFEEALAPSSTPIDAVAIQGYLMAFRRSDAIARGPLDEGFRFYRNLDIWWSLVLRDEGEDAPPRRALIVPGLSLTRGEPRAWATTAPAERDRLSKRNFYRVLDRFRTRLDLAVR